MGKKKQLEKARAERLRRLNNAMQTINDNFTEAFAGMAESMVNVMSGTAGFQKKDTHLVSTDKCYVCGQKHTGLSVLQDSNGWHAVCPVTGALLEVWRDGD